MMESVAVFTDSYLPTVNGVTYTITEWRSRWLERGGRMDVVYPHTSDHCPRTGEIPVRSLPFPFYEGFRYGLPKVPRSVLDVDVVHVHTPFPVGFGGVRLARSEDISLVASYHTPTGKYAGYLAPGSRLAAAVRGFSEYWERFFFDQADLVLAPSAWTREHLRTHVGVTTPVRVLPNGVDLDRFSPVDTAGFVQEHGLDTGKPLVGYTGRHGYEKNLTAVVEACADLDVTVVFGGDGPAREDLESTARNAGVDARFLGFLDREDLPAFYSALDAFAFPSPVETQGIVALEANACGTPVAGVDSAALADTIDDGETGYTAPEGDVGAFREAIRRTLDERERLREGCLSRRDRMGVEHSVDRLAEIYDGLA